jgi:hypothetical protein
MSGARLAAAGTRTVRREPQPRDQEHGPPEAISEEPDRPATHPYPNEPEGDGRDAASRIVGEEPARSVVQEQSQREDESLTTRIVPSYNHTHALTVQYFEVRKLYRVVAWLGILLVAVAIGAAAVGAAW